MRISDWSSDVCSSDLLKNTGARTGDEVAQLYLHQRSGTSSRPVRELKGFQRVTLKAGEKRRLVFTLKPDDLRYWSAVSRDWVSDDSVFDVWIGGSSAADLAGSFRSEEHTSELQSLMRISYAVFCLKKKTQRNTPNF